MLILDDHELKFRLKLELRQNTNSIKHVFTPGKNELK